LRRDLLPRVQAVRELAARFLAESADAAPVFRTDAVRLDGAGADLLENTRYLVSLSDLAPGPEATALLYRASPALLNILNRVAGYSQLLLEAEEEGLLALFRQDLERICILSQECERVIHEHLTRNLPASAPVAGKEELAPPESRRSAGAAVLV